MSRLVFKKPRLVTEVPVSLMNDFREELKHNRAQKIIFFSYLFMVNAIKSGGNCLVVYNYLRNIFKKALFFCNVRAFRATSIGNTCNFGKHFPNLLCSFVSRETVLRS